VESQDRGFTPSLEFMVLPEVSPSNGGGRVTNANRRTQSAMGLKRKTGEKKIKGRGDLAEEGID